MNKLIFNMNMNMNSNTSTSDIANLLDNTSIIDNAIIYARCSTKSQNQNKNTSLSTQIAECNRYCNDHNYNVIKIINEIVGGHDKNKQTYNSILDNYSNANIIICDPSRLSRNICDAINFLTECIKRKLKIHFVRDNLICTTIYDCKQFANLIFDAMTESQTISKRIRHSITIRKRMGSHIGKPSYGFSIKTKLDVESGINIRKMIKNSTEMNYIKLIQTLYFGGNINNIYNNLHIVFPNGIDEYKLTEMDGTPFTEVYWGNLCLSDIATLLNENDGTNRGKRWTSSAIKQIVTKHKCKPYTK